MLKPRYASDPNQLSGALLPREDANNIIWIASYPGSGNTWVRAFVHNLLNELAGGSYSAQDINRLSEHTAWIATEHFERATGKPIVAMSRREVAKIRPEVQRQLSNTKSGPFFVKTHMAVGYDFQFPTINLNATLAGVYIVRNPLDVSISFARCWDKSIDDTIAMMGTEDFKSSTTKLTVSEFLGSWSQNVASWVAITRRPVHILRYEDMLDNPLRSFSNLARFLRMSASEAQLRAAIAKSSFAELKRQEEQHGFNERPATTRRFFREGHAGRWRDELARAQIQDIVRTHAPMMQRFGYLPPDCSMFGSRPAT
jgi:hypothetical protein